LIHLSQFGSNEKIKDDPKREEVTSSDSDASVTSSNGSPKKKRANLSDVKQQLAREKQEAKNSETVRKSVAKYSGSLGNDKILQNQVWMIEVIRSESIYEN
jgi:hypothetical protein